jgi:hypothetical protein
MSALAIMRSSRRTGRMIRRSPSLASTFRALLISSLDYFWGDDAWARFMACINLGRMSFSMIVFGGVNPAL